MSGVHTYTTRLDWSGSTGAGYEEYGRRGQLLSFLAAAARSRIDVLEYTDDAEGTMDEAERPPWVQRIVLEPEIEVRA